MTCLFTNIPTFHHPSSLHVQLRLISNISDFKQKCFQDFKNFSTPLSLHTISHFSIFATFLCIVPHFCRIFHFANPHNHINSECIQHVTTIFVYILCTYVFYFVVMYFLLYFCIFVVVFLLYFEYFSLYISLFFSIYFCFCFFLSLFITFFHINYTPYMPSVYKG